MKAVKHIPLIFICLNYYTSDQLKTASDKLLLTGELTFDTRHSKLDGHPQLRELNAYADISFKSNTSTMSKMRLEKESVTVFPAVKFKLGYEVKSSGQNIRVWNSLGEIFDQ